MRTRIGCRFELQSSDLQGIPSQYNSVKLVVDHDSVAKRYAATHPISTIIAPGSTFSRAVLQAAGSNQPLLSFDCHVYPSKAVTLRLMAAAQTDAKRSLLSRGLQWHQLATATLPLDQLAQQLLLPGVAAAKPAASLSSASIPAGGVPQPSTPGSAAAATSPFAGPSTDTDDADSMLYTTDSNAAAASREFGRPASQGSSAAERDTGVVRDTTDDAACYRQQVQSSRFPIAWAVDAAEHVGILLEQELYVTARLLGERGGLGSLLGLKGSGRSGRSRRSSASSWDAGGSRRRSFVHIGSMPGSARASVDQQHVPSYVPRSVTAPVMDRVPPEGFRSQPGTPTHKGPAGLVTIQPAIAAEGRLPSLGLWASPTGSESAGAAPGSLASPTNGPTYPQAGGMSSPFRDGPPNIFSASADEPRPTVVASQMTTVTARVEEGVKQDQTAKREFLQLILSTLSTSYSMESDAPLPANMLEPSAAQLAAAASLPRAPSAADLAAFAAATGLPIDKVTKAAVTKLTSGSSTAGSSPKAGAGQAFAAQAQSSAAQPAAATGAKAAGQAAESTEQAEGNPAVPAAAGAAAAALAAAAAGVGVVSYGTETVEVMPGEQVSVPVVAVAEAAVAPAEAIDAAGRSDQGQNRVFNEPIASTLGTAAATEAPITLAAADVPVEITTTATAMAILNEPLDAGQEGWHPQALAVATASTTADAAGGEGVIVVTTTLPHISGGETVTGLQPSEEVLVQQFVVTDDGLKQLPSTSAEASAVAAVPGEDGKTPLLADVNAADQEKALHALQPVMLPAQVPLAPTSPLKDLSERYNSMVSSQGSGRVGSRRSSFGISGAAAVADAPAAAENQASNNDSGSKPSVLAPAFAAVSAALAAASTGAAGLVAGNRQEAAYDSLDVQGLGQSGSQERNTLIGLADRAQGMDAERWASQPKKAEQPADLQDLDKSLGSTGNANAVHDEVDVDVLTAEDQQLLDVPHKGIVAQHYNMTAAEQAGKYRLQAGESEIIPDVRGMEDVRVTNANKHHAQAAPAGRVDYLKSAFGSVAALSDIDTYIKTDTAAEAPASSTAAPVVPQPQEQLQLQHSERSWMPQLAPVRYVSGSDVLPRQSSSRLAEVLSKLDMASRTLSVQYHLEPGTPGSPWAAAAAGGAGRAAAAAAAVVPRVLASSSAAAFRLFQTTVEPVTVGTAIAAGTVLPTLVSYGMALAAWSAQQALAAARVTAGLAVDAALMLPRTAAWAAGVSAPSSSSRDLSPAAAKPTGVGNTSVRAASARGYAAPAGAEGDKIGSTATFDSAAGQTAAQAGTSAICAVEHGPAVPAAAATHGGTSGGLVYRLLWQLPYEAVMVSVGLWLWAAYQVLVRPLMLAPRFLQLGATDSSRVGSQQLYGQDSSLSRHARKFKVVSNVDELGSISKQPVAAAPADSSLSSAAGAGNSSSSVLGVGQQASSLLLPRKSSLGWLLSRGNKAAVPVPPTPAPSLESPSGPAERTWSSLLAALSPAATLTAALSRASSLAVLAPTPTSTPTSTSTPMPAPTPTPTTAQSASLQAGLEVADEVAAAEGGLDITESSGDVAALTASAASAAGGVHIQGRCRLGGITGLPAPTAADKHDFAAPASLDSNGSVGHLGGRHDASQDVRGFPWWSKQWTQAAGGRMPEAAFAAAPAAVAGTAAAHNRLNSKPDSRSWWPSWTTFSRQTQSSAQSVTATRDTAANPAAARSGGVNHVQPSWWLAWLGLRPATDGRVVANEGVVVGDMDASAAAGTEQATTTAPVAAVGGDSSAGIVGLAAAAQQTRHHPVLRFWQHMFDTFVSAPALWYWHAVSSVLGAGVDITSHLVGLLVWWALLPGRLAWWSVVLPIKATTWAAKQLVSPQRQVQELQAEQH